MVLVIGTLHVTEMCAKKKRKERERGYIMLQKNDVIHKGKLKQNIKMKAMKKR